MSAKTEETEQLGYPHNLISSFVYDSFIVCIQYINVTLAVSRFKVLANLFAAKQLFQINMDCKIVFMILRHISSILTMLTKLIHQLNICFIFVSLF